MAVPCQTTAHSCMNCTCRCLKTDKSNTFSTINDISDVFIRVERDWLRSLSSDVLPVPGWQTALQLTGEEFSSAAPDAGNHYRSHLLSASFSGPLPWIPPSHPYSRQPECWTPSGSSLNQAPVSSSHPIMKCDIFLQSPEVVLSCPSMWSSMASGIRWHDTDDPLGHRCVPPTPSSSWMDGFLEQMLLQSVFVPFYVLFSRTASLKYQSADVLLEWPGQLRAHQQYSCQGPRIAPGWEWGPRQTC